MLNYIDRIAARIGDNCGMTLDRTAEGQLLRIYALLAITLGHRVTREDVHDAWAVWRCDTKPDHPSIRPFYELSAETQALDQPYVDAIKVAVREFTL